MTHEDVLTGLATAFVVYYFAIHFVAIFAVARGTYTRVKNREEYSARDLAGLYFSVLFWPFMTSFR